ncbi:hypothetical protein [Paenibacillus sp. OSY-SE]|uniref:hypothetical protein n=1 Tax=Paenibacillus sp. OSY-SE TaxID=1196323 RepID=UPI0002D37E86|nr:hypothetical protein [Paenibacillus sp. OSY-SE]
MEIIDNWLEENRLVPWKPTFSGRQRTVLAYIRKQKWSMKCAKTYERLEHLPRGSPGLFYDHSG